MKKLTQEKVKNAVTCLILLLVIVSQNDRVLAAFNLSLKSHEKVVTVYDGQDKYVVKTTADNFKTVLNELNLSMSTYDTFWSSSKEVEDGSILVLERAVPVTLVAGNARKVVYTTQQTVQGVVNDAGFDWKTMMPLEDGMTIVKPGMQVHVVPYTAKIIQRDEVMPVHYRKWYDSRLAPGEMQIVQQGTAGQRKVQVEEFISDGKVIKTTVLHADVTVPGIPGIAKTGNPEEAVGYVTTMDASAYHPGDGNGLGITATGTKAGRGTVAVDPRIIPLGSSLFIPAYGEAVAEDTGGAIQGNRIDLCMDTYQECYNFGRQNIEVFVNY